MLKYNFMFQIMNNMQNIGRCYATTPQQQSGFYPGLSLGGGGGVPQQQTYEDYLQQQQDKQDFEQLKASYSGFKFTNIGGEYKARLTSNPSVRFSGSTPLELMEAMDEYIDEHPEDFKSKPAKKETSREDVEGNIERDEVANDADDVGNTDGAEASANSNNNSNAASNNSANPNTGVKLPQGWHHNINQAWIKQNFTDKNITTPTAEQIIMAFNGNDTLNMSGISAENKAKLIDDLKKYNPSCFNSDGTGKSPFSWDKLDIPGSNILKNTYGVPEKAKAPANKSDNTWAYGCTGQYKYTDSNGEGIHIKYKGTQNRIYQKNGNSSIDDDAIFVINGQQYKIICTNTGTDSKKLDYCEITGQRSLGSDFTLIHHETGKFNATSTDMSWTYTNQDSGAKENMTFRLLPINGGTWIDIYLKNGQVYMNQGNKEYLADDIMFGKQKF